MREVWSRENVAYKKRYEIYPYLRGKYMNCKESLWSDTSDIRDFCIFRRNKFESCIGSLPTVSSLCICRIGTIKTCISKSTRNMKNNWTISIDIFYGRRPIRTHNILTCYKWGFIFGFFHDPTTILWKWEEICYWCLIESCCRDNRFPIPSCWKGVPGSTRTVLKVRGIPDFLKGT